MSRCFLLLAVFILASLSLTGQYRINDIPNPKEKGEAFYVSNPEGLIGAQITGELNQIAAEIEEKTTAEVAVVIVDDFQGEDDFSFAFELFNTWGIGKAESDNGLLLFVATDRRNYRFITGYGMEPVLPDGLLRLIGENYLVPEFKKGNYGQGMLDAMEVIRGVILSPESAADLQHRLERENSFFYRHQTWLQRSGIVILLTIICLIWGRYVLLNKVLPRSDSRRVRKKSSIGKGCLTAVAGLVAVIFIVFIAIFVFWGLGWEVNRLFQLKVIPIYTGLVGMTILALQYGDGRQNIKSAFRDEKNRLQALKTYNQWMLIPMILSPLLLIAFITQARYAKKVALRLQPPDDSGKWIRLNRDEIRKKTPLLSKGQQQEEKLLARSYELWKHAESKEIKAIAWPGKKHRKFSACPECGFLTLAKPYLKTIQRATYRSSGKGERLQECEFCDYKISLGMKVIPKKIRSSSGSSSSGGGRSGGSSGSFGGGSSGGGGAGGSW